MTSFYPIAAPLGYPIPDDPHAVSVSLPTWAAVVGYEEGRPDVVGAMQLGYPRFVYHPAYRRLCEAVKAAQARADEEVLVFPAAWVAEEARQYIGEGRVQPSHGLWAVLFPATLAKKAKEYWQHAGFIVSSRQAEDALAGALRTDDARHVALRGWLGDVYGMTAEAISLYPSGMAAIYQAYRLACARRPGAATVQLGFPYLDTLKIQQKFGRGHYIAYNSPADLSALEALLQAEPVAAVFTEVPSNPLLHTVDFKTLRTMLQRYDVPLVVDDTIATAFNVDIRPYADIIVTSLTKFYSGVGNVCAGALVCVPQGRFADASDLRPMLYAADAAVLLDNTKNFVARMRAINTNAAALSHWLARQPAIALVYHPSLTDTAHYDVVRTPQGGYGGLLSFVLKDAAAAPHVYDALAVQKGPSLGTPYTLACPYTLLAHYYELDWAAQSQVPAHLIRVSVGMEPLDALLAAFDKALTIVECKHE